MLETVLQTDGIITLLYFSVVLAVGLSSSWKKETTSIGYFLSGRSIGWFSLGASTIAADALCGHLVEPREMSVGAIVIETELLSIVCLLLIGWVIGPKFIAKRNSTVTEFFSGVFNRDVGTYISAAYIIMYLLTRLSLVLFVGGYLLQSLSGPDVYMAIAAMILIPGLYAIVGGLPAVINTQAFQAVVFLIGLVAFTAATLHSVAWQDASTISVFSGIRNGSAFDVGTPWLALIIGLPIVVMWFWLADQYMLQRVFGARSERDLKKGTSLAIIIKVLIVIPALLIVLMLPHDVFSLAAIKISPSYKSLILIGIYSIMMASLAGLFNSTSALFTLNLYRRKHPGASEGQLILVGRLSTMGIVVISLLWMPLVNVLDWQRSSMLQSLLAYFAATIIAVSLSGLLWRRSTASGAVAGLIIGMLFGIVRILVEHFIAPVSVGNQILSWLLYTNYLNFATIVFLCSIFAIVVVSLRAPSTNRGFVGTEAGRNN